MAKDMTDAQHHEWETIKRMVAEGVDEWYGYQRDKNGAIQVGQGRRVNINTLRGIRDAGWIEFMSGVKRFHLTQKGYAQFVEQYGKQLTVAPEEQGSDAPNEYTRDEEQARLLARIRELEEGYEAILSELVVARPFNDILDDVRAIAQRMLHAEDATVKDS